MEYKKLKVGIRKILIAQTIEVVILAISLTLSLIMVSCYLLFSNSSVSDVFSGIYIVASGVLVVATIVSYLIMISGVLSASKAEKKFKETAAWIIGSFICYFVLNALTMILGISLVEIESIVSNVVLIIGTLSIIDGIACVAEKLGDTKTRTLAERCINFFVIAYIVIILYDILSLILSSENTDEIATLIISLISDLLKLVTYSLVFYVFKKADKTVRSYSSETFGCGEDEVIA